MAAHNGHVTVIKELLDHGAKIDSVNGKEWTSFDIAERNSNVSAIELLGQTCVEKTACAKYMSDNKQELNSMNSSDTRF
jgi:ankyrin repeat protein